MANCGGIQGRDALLFGETVEDVGTKLTRPNAAFVA